MNTTKLNDLDPGTTTIEETADEYAFSPEYAAMIEDAVQEARKSHTSDASRETIRHSAEAAFLGEITMDEVEGIGYDAIVAWIYNEVDLQDGELATDGGHNMPPDEDDFRNGPPDSETTRFESTDGSHEVAVSIPSDRKHLSGLVDAMDKMDKRAHRAGRHDDDPHEDCPLCPDKRWSK